MADIPTTKFRIFGWLAGSVCQRALNRWKITLAENLDSLGDYFRRRILKRSQTKTEVYWFNQNNNKNLANIENKKFIDNYKLQILRSNLG